MRSLERPEPALFATFNACDHADRIETPMSRWGAHEAKRFVVESPENELMIPTERTYTSPIRYFPEG